MTDAGALLYYKLSWRAIGSGELNIMCTLVNPSFTIYIHKLGSSGSILHGHVSTPDRQQS